MATPTEMVAIIEAAIAENPVGVVSLNVDGTTVSWDSDKAHKMLDYWRLRKAQQLGTKKPKVGRLDLGAAW